jgi:zinc/manganese transport system substrate-binding protein
MSKSFRFSIAALLAACSVFACAARAADKLPVVASFSILGDVVGRVGGDRVAVTTLVGPDQDAHVYQPTPEDIKKVTRARLVAVNGLGFEGWLERLARAANYKGEIVVASAGIAPLEMPDEDQPDHGHAHQKTDPHAWQNPLNVVTYTRNIVAALSKLDPAGAALYKRNGDAYVAALTQLDNWAAAQIATIPAARRRIITSHDAFQYFGAHYKIDFIAPQGMSTDSEPSAREVAAMIRQMKKERIRAVFIENMSSPKLLEQISREAGTSAGGKLYSDALSGPQGAAPDYLSMMRYNIQQILSGLRKN